jgi:hypothetical protein
MDFLGLTLDTTLSWEGHKNKIIPKLNSARFALRTVKLFLCKEELKIVYFAYVHSVISYGIIFWGNAYSSKNAFLAQKRIIRNIMNANPTASCHGFFKRLNILPFFFPNIYFLCYYL